MQRIEKDYGSYKLHLYPTDQYKNNCCRIIFQLPIEKKKITIYSVLCDMLSKATKNHPTSRELCIALEELYSASISISNYRTGNYQSICFQLDMLNDSYTESGNFFKGLDLLHEFIFSPFLSEEYFSIVVDDLTNYLKTIKENPASYSETRLREEISSTHPIGFRTVGYLEDLSSITLQDVKNAYKDMIREGMVDIFILGDFSISELQNKIKSSYLFKVIHRKKISFKTDTLSFHRRIVSKEKIDNSQSRLDIGISLRKLTDYEKTYVLVLYNLILGGMTNSKLFQEIREKYSYCYSIYSTYQRLDSFFFISAGIDRSNYKKVVDLIEKNLYDMKHGRFTLDSVLEAKENFKTAAITIKENPYTLLGNYIGEYYGELEPIDLRVKNMAKVTKKDIITLAKKIKINVIFLLEGDRV